MGCRVLEINQVFPRVIHYSLFSCKDNKKNIAIVKFQNSYVIVVQEVLEFDYIILTTNPNF